MLKDDTHKLDARRSYFDGYLIIAALLETVLLFAVINYDPFGLTSLADRTSKELLLKIAAPFYPWEHQLETAVVLIDDRLPLVGGGSSEWPPSYFEYVYLLDKILSQRPKAVFLDIAFDEAHKESRRLAILRHQVVDLLSNCDDQGKCELDANGQDLVAYIDQRISFEDISCFAYALSGLSAQANTTAKQAAPNNCEAYEQYYKRFSSYQIPVVFAIGSPKNYDASNQEVALSNAEHTTVLQSRTLVPELASLGLAVSFTSWIAVNDDYRNILWSSTVDPITVGPISDTWRDQPLCQRSGHLNPELTRQEIYLSAAAHLYLIARCQEMATLPHLDLENAGDVIDLHFNKQDEMSVVWGINPNAKAVNQRDELFSCEAELDQAGTSDRPEQVERSHGFHSGQRLGYFWDMLNLGFESGNTTRTQWQQLINPKCPFHAYTFASEIVQGKIEDKGVLTDKYVFLGSSAALARDSRPSLLNAMIPGVFEHAMAFDNLRVYKEKYKRNASTVTVGFDLIGIQYFVEGVIVFVTALLIGWHESGGRGRQPTASFGLRFRVKLSCLMLLLTLLIVIFCYWMSLIFVNWIAILGSTFYLNMPRLSTIKVWVHQLELVLAWIKRVAEHTVH